MASESLSSEPLGNGPVARGPQAGVQRQEGRAEQHPAAWLAWLAAAAVPALLTRNPLYLSLVLGTVAIAYLSLAQRDPAAGNWSRFVRFGALLWLLSVPFTMLTAHQGRLVLFRLPAGWPVVGGPVTGESLLYGLGGGLALVTLLLAFAAFNLAVDQARLLRLTPGFIYQAGVVAAIAVAFVPQVMATWQAVSEAQAVRGHRVRGLRGLLPLLIPLLVTALERAVQLAESMESRGFGGDLHPAEGNRRLMQLLALLGGLAALSAGVAGASFWPAQAGGAALLAVVGLAALAWSFWDQGRAIRRSRYRRWQWGPGDRWVLAAGTLAAAGWLVVWAARGDWLFYYPYPPYSPWPGFEPVVGALALVAALPAFVAPRGESRSA